MLTRILTLLMLCALAACAGIAPETRRQHSAALASAQGWQALRIATRDFVLAAYVPATTTAEQTLTVYIEGDGMAWLSRSQASDDPTPRQPLALELAMRQARGTAVYLARPCQYVEGAARRGCDVAYWTERRFAPQVIEASSEAIDTLKLRYGAEHLILVGYSGGGAVAALVAARRSDVVRLVTVAGNLDHRAWTIEHGVLPLTGSLNPADDWAALQHIPQLHFVGATDANVSTSVVAAYLARFPEHRRPDMQVVPGADHSCCWAQQWPALSSQALP